MFSFQDVDRNANVISNENALVKVDVGTLDTISRRFSKDALTIDIRPDENLFIGPVLAPTETTSAMEMQHQENSENTENVLQLLKYSDFCLLLLLSSKGISSPQTGASNSILFFLGLTSLLFGAAFVLARRKNIVVVENV